MYNVPASIERKMEARFKRLIRKNALIDTGALYKSIQMTAWIDDSGYVTIKLYSEDYLKYLDDRFSLSADFLYGPKFNTILIPMYEGWINYMIKKYPRLGGFERVLENIDPRNKIDLIIVN